MITPKNSLNRKWRERAEREVNSRPTPLDTHYSEYELLKSKHELEVYQVELELINDELQRAEEDSRKLGDKYLELFDFAPTGYMTLDSKGIIEEANLAAGALLGLNREQLIRKSLIPFLSKESRRTLSSYLDNLIESTQKADCEIAIRTNTGEVKYAYVTGVVKRDNADQCFLNLVDITDRKATEKTLQIAKEKAEKSDRLKTSFLANLSHEIRTPMNGILGFSELLKTPQLSPKNQSEYIRLIELSGSRMLSILNDIISMSQIESDNTRIVLTETYIHESLVHLYDFFLPEAQLKNIELKFTIDEDLSLPTISTDQDKFYGILSNLVKNAIKFTHNGSVEFGYKKKSEHWEFYVKDTGVGISIPNRDLIFERFRQVEDHLTRRHGGSGLGLSIAKAYAEMLGGKIWLGDSTNNGSVFYFSLPNLPAQK